MVIIRIVTLVHPASYFERPYLMNSVIIATQLILHACLHCEPSNMSLKIKVDHIAIAIGDVKYLWMVM